LRLLKMQLKVKGYVDSLLRVMTVEHYYSA